METVAKNVLKQSKEGVEDLWFTYAENHMFFF